MYPGKHAGLRPDQPAVIMAASGEVLTYGQLERRSNRLAHLLRANGLRRLDLPTCGGIARGLSAPGGIPGGPG